MTHRKIIIKTCDSCPHHDHQGGFGQVAYIPVCTKGKRRELPYTVGQGHGTMIVATQKRGIPDWCPLPKDV